jgi:uncharacterized membrane protein
MSNHPIHAYDSPLLAQAPTSGLERLAGVISHGSMLAGFPLFVPIVVLLVFPLLGGNSRFVRHTAVQALLFQLMVTVVGGILLGIAGTFFAAPFLTAVFPPLLVIFGPIVAVLTWPIALIFALLGGAFVVWGVWIELVATWKAFKGEQYRMPIVGGFGA